MTDGLARHGAGPTPQGAGSTPQGADDQSGGTVHRQPSGTLDRQSLGTLQGASPGTLNDPYAPLVIDRDGSRADSGATPQSPARIFWKQLRKSPLAIAGGAVLTLFYLLAI